MCIHHFYIPFEAYFCDCCCRCCGRIAYVWFLHACALTSIDFIWSIYQIYCQHQQFIGLTIAWFLCEFQILKLLPIYWSQGKESGRVNKLNSNRRNAAKHLKKNIMLCHLSIVQNTRMIFPWQRPIEPPHGEIVQRIVCTTNDWNFIELQNVCKQCPYNTRTHTQTPTHIHTQSVSGSRESARNVNSALKHTVACKTYIKW